MRKKARQGDTEVYVTAFKEPINKAVSSMSRKEAFKPEKYQEIKRYAEEKTRSKATRLKRQ